MELIVNVMELQTQKNSTLIRALLYSLIFFLSVGVSSISVKVYAEENRPENRFETSHLSHAAKYGQIAYSASTQGRWHQAREAWEKAVEHLEQADASDRNRAVFYYELGHAAGITCDFEIAEEFIEKSYQIEKAINGPYVLTLVELFRLYFDQKQYKMASIYFEAALPNLIASNAEENTPARYTRLLDEYADTLNQIDNFQLASQMKRQSRQIRIQAGKLTGHDRRILYGSRCRDSRQKFPVTVSKTALVSIRMSKIREILKTMNKFKKQLQK